MLDLKKLEEKLDIALSHETGESISLWLQEKRIKEFTHPLGDGCAKNIIDAQSELFNNMTGNPRAGSLKEHSKK